VLVLSVGCVGSGVRGLTTVVAQVAMAGGSEDTLSLVMVIVVIVIVIMSSLCHWG